MNEQQAKLYFGWTPDSRLPGQTYAHLINADADVAVLREKLRSDSGRHRRPSTTAVPRVWRTQSTAGASSVSAVRKCSGS